MLHPVRQSGVNKMKREQMYFKNMIFILVMGFISLVVLVINTFFPDILLPYISIPMMVLFVAISEIIAAYLKVVDRGCFYIKVLLGGISLAIIPFAAGITGDRPFYVLLLLGFVIYGCVDYIYASIVKRMASGNTTLLAPVVNGLMLFLACQAFQGLI